MAAKLVITPPLALEHIPLNLHRLNAAGIICFWAIHQIADGINLSGSSSGRSSANLYDSLRASSTFNHQPK